MSSRRARLSANARRWLDAEIDYLAERNPVAARKLVDAMRAAQYRIAKFPRSGRGGGVADTRQFVVIGYLLTVQIRGEGVEIASIRHGRQHDAHAPSDFTDDSAEE